MTLTNEGKTGPPRHIVALGGLVTDADGRVLLIRSPRRDWEFPGGQVEEGEDLIAALQREILEETGITISVGPLVGVYSNTRSHIVMFGFLCTYVSGEPTTSTESLEVAWVDREEARKRVTRHPSPSPRPPPRHARLRRSGGLPILCLRRGGGWRKRIRRVGGTPGVTAQGIHGRAENGLLLAFSAKQHMTTSRIMTVYG